MWLVATNFVRPNCVAPTVSTECGYTVTQTVTGCCTSMLYRHQPSVVMDSGRPNCRVKLCQTNTVTPTVSGCYAVATDTDSHTLTCLVATNCQTKRKEQAQLATHGHTDSVWLLQTVTVSLSTEHGDGQCLVATNFVNRVLTSTVSH